MELKEIISELSSIPGPSGSESAVAARFKEIIEPFMDDVRTDTLGNVIGYKACGKKRAKILLLDAHIDEVGLVVTGIEEGFLKFACLGRIDPLMLSARQVKVMTEPPIFGVIGCMPVHALSAEEMNKPTKTDDMFIDIGLSDEKARAAVPLGTPVVFHGRCGSLAGDVLSGKAMDNRACMAVIVRTLDLIRGKELDVDLIVMGSTQEELGHRGAITGAFGTMPDYAVAVDVTHAKTPDYKKEKAFVFGGGVAIGIGPNMSRAFSEKLISLAKEKGISHQIEVMGGNSGTNALVMQTVGEGIATAIVSLPIKYMHTPVEAVKLSDAEAAAGLLAELVLSMKGGEL